jgi:serine/threonine protein kinase
MFPDAPPLAIDLMGKLLHLDPNKRLLAKQALNHPYLKTKK